jgi:branched-chain amino acid transport system permease protein
MSQSMHAGNDIDATSGSEVFLALDRYHDLSRRQRLWWAWLWSLGILLLALVPLFSTSDYDIGRYTVAVAYLMAAMGLNLSFGYAGEMTLGHPVIMGVAAYAAGLINVYSGLSPWIAAPVGASVGVLIGALMLLPGLRVSGWYLALITMFAVVVFPPLITLGEDWTGGEYGLTGIQKMYVFGTPLNDVAMFELAVVAFAVVTLFLANLLDSHWVYRLLVLRDARQAGQSVGIQLTRTRLVVYFLCAVPPAIAGAILAFAQRFVNADSFDFGLTLVLLTGVVLGSGGTFVGPILGTIPLIALSFWVGPFSPFNAIALGLGLLVAALVFPDGLVLSFKKVFRAKDSYGAGETLRNDDVPIAIKLKEGDSGSQPRRTVMSAVGISKHFGGQRVLENIHIDLPSGMVVGLVGPNGSGKSTLLNTLSGMVVPTTGRINLNGTEITGWPVHRIAGFGVGRTFQIPQLVDDLTVLENISLGNIAKDPLPLWRCILRLPTFSFHSERLQTLRLACDAFNRVGLPIEVLTRPASELPLGLKRMCEIARSLVASRSVLLLDEPAAGLNDAERAQLGTLLRQLAAQGIAVLVVEHNVGFVMKYCDRLILLQAGTVTCEADPSDAALPSELDRYLSYAPDRNLKQPATA